LVDFSVGVVNYSDDEVHKDHEQDEGLHIEDYKGENHYYLGVAVYSGSIFLLICKVEAHVGINE